jgi:integrase/recombinase XerD
MNGETISPLRRRMIEDMTVRKFVEKTQKDYIRHVKGLTIFLGRSPDTATAEDLRRYQLHLTERGVPHAEHQRRGFGAALLLLRHA